MAYIRYPPRRRGKNPPHGTIRISFSRSLASNGLCFSVVYMGCVSLSGTPVSRGVPDRRQVARFRRSALWGF
ncbi:hypothetical protein BDV28DRAFT_140064 [Aspergillus coremiiformis]|uniref:Uncharacterized protein n=1 Tax=Aspergillus coremiiformis TaxID=138285 RepID=A0A5N6YZ46_9EURO|nr:hypothetical protein BDV28DRAFT_140064 [Aspergillus coremiiformis]